MNVLYLTMNPNRQSTTVPTEGWLRVLRSAGLKPVLVSNKAGTFHQWAIEQKIPAYEVELPQPDKWRPWRFMRSLMRLRAIARKHNVQLIHCNEQDIYPNGQYLARLLGAPVVVSVHFTMARPYCEWAFGGKRKPSRIFFTSRGNLDACRVGVTGVIEEQRWRVLNNGIDMNFFRPDDLMRMGFRKQYAQKGETLIGVACALRPRKQLEHLFRAAMKLSANIKVVVAGGAVSGDEEYSENLIEQGRQLLGDRLISLGHLDDLRSFYNGLDLFVNTSQEEACSLSILECMSSGCPVVGYASKTVHTQILPEGGQIVPQDDIDALSSAIECWTSSPERLLLGRAGARKRVSDDFCLTKASAQLWQEYSAVLEETPL